VTAAKRPGGLVGEDTLVSCFLQGGKLQVWVLVFGRNPRIAHFHGLILSMILGTANLLIYHECGFVSKPLLISSRDRSECSRRHKHGASSNATLCHNKRTTV